MPGPEESRGGDRDASRLARRRRAPVAERGRFGRFVGGLRDYALIGWWGLLRPRVVERRTLELSQAVILRTDPATGEEQVLLSIRRDLFGWELPGGTVERGEPMTDTAIREVREETGLDVAIEAHVGDWTRDGFRPHVAHVFRCVVEGGALTPSWETPRLGWFPAHAPPAALFPWYREPLRRALARATGESVREWQGLAWIGAAISIDLSMRWRGLPAGEHRGDAASA